jgi:hypothetical protein
MQAHCALRGESKASSSSHLTEILTASPDALTALAALVYSQPFLCAQAWFTRCRARPWRQVLQGSSALRHLPPVRARIGAHTDMPRSRPPPLALLLLLLLAAVADGLKLRLSPYQARAR